MHKHMLVDITCIHADTLRAHYFIHMQTRNSYHAIIQLAKQLQQAWGNNTPQYEVVHLQIKANAPSHMANYNMPYIYICRINHT